MQLLDNQDLSEQVISAYPLPILLEVHALDEEEAAFHPLVGDRSTHSPDISHVPTNLSPKLLRSGFGSGGCWLA